MAKFIINKTYSDPITVEARAFEVGPVWVAFYTDSTHPVYAIATSKVATVEKEGASQ